MLSESPNDGRHLQLIGILIIYSIDLDHAFDLHVSPSMFTAEREIFNKSMNLIIRNFIIKPNPTVYCLIVTTFMFVKIYDRYGKRM